MSSPAEAELKLDATEVGNIWESGNFITEEETEALRG
jgi:hypothetical protein